MVLPSGGKMDTNNARYTYASASCISSHTPSNLVHSFQTWIVPCLRQPRHCLTGAQ
ncbi:hypothetical protein HETIRDRAFT_477965 [Heterobasidion irregulare TC 32-1]|uniref:Uncharacterized protein n=1 Tax=Heterobasidion irregulare (strain TC 32-1) TaxID=747525 RepID=W4K025_HETIT|nr:uncharacterized protein HETIRDRAFT_477965 [Heterobasidion irregulare TC 32-1]ETW78690.1 hypothetical protein HETIRDRAFT_477965 [Heterobasidion irregulare TC 32-1]